MYSQDRTLLQTVELAHSGTGGTTGRRRVAAVLEQSFTYRFSWGASDSSFWIRRRIQRGPQTVSYTHLRAHETRHDLVCRLLLEKKKNNIPKDGYFIYNQYSKDTIKQTTHQH